MALLKRGTNMLLEVKGLTKSFGGLIAVKNLSFSVNEGEIVGLIGPNGAGKTTVFNLITGFLKPDYGIIKFNGENITGAKPHKIARKGIARTFQIVNPFSEMTCLDNVSVSLYGKGEKRQNLKRRAREILEQVGLEHRENELAKNLPHGELKKLELARALALDPKLLLLDEIFAGLSFEETNEIINLLRALKKEDKAIIIIEHVMRVIMSISDYVIVMSSGEKIASGKPIEVAKDMRVIRAYMGGDIVA